MEMRVEQLSVRADLSVDTIRYYQSKGLLDPPRREGRIAWYDSRHLERLQRIRALQQRGFTLATIARLVSGELDAADEDLVGELSGLNVSARRPAHVDRPGHDPARGHGPTGTGGIEADGPGREPASELLTIAELAARTGVPLALLQAVEAEGLLIPRRVGDRELYTTEDVAASRAALLFLEWGIPLSDLLELARRHHEATRSVARDAVSMFSRHVRGPLHRGKDPRTHVGPAGGDTAQEGEVARLLQAYAELLPAADMLVGHHFTRTLIQAALDHVEQVGSDAERRAVWDQIDILGPDEPDVGGTIGRESITDGTSSEPASVTGPAVITGAPSMTDHNRVRDRATSITEPRP